MLIHLEGSLNHGTLEWGKVIELYCAHFPNLLPPPITIMVPLLGECVGYLNNCLYLFKREGSCIIFFLVAIIAFCKINLINIMLISLVNNSHGLRYSFRHPLDVTVFNYTVHSGIDRSS